MSLRETVKAAIASSNVLAVAISSIALGADHAEQIARDALAEVNIDPVHVLRVHADMKKLLSQVNDQQMA